MKADVVVVGGGISGVACASRCAEEGLTVEVLDRGRRIGGRLATRTLRDGEPHPADQGAPYFTVSDDRFRAVVERWLDRGLAHEWTDTFVTAGPLGLGDPKPGPMRYASSRGSRALVEDLAAGLAVHADHLVETLEAGRRIGRRTPKVVVLAMPGPQAARVLAAHHGDLAVVAEQPYDPAIVLTARFADRTWPAFDGAFVANVPELRWVADDGRSRGDDAPVLVAHSSPAFAREHLAEPQAARDPMLKALRGVIGASGDPVETRVHRWTYAQPTGERRETHLLTAAGIGLCGDGWSRRSRVEAAWLSGDDLGAAIAARLT